MNITCTVGGFRLGLQNRFFENDDFNDDGDDDDKHNDVMGNWGLKGLKPKAKF